MRIRRSTLPLHLQTPDRVTALLGASLGTYHRDTSFSLTVTLPGISTFLPPFPMDGFASRPLPPFPTQV